MFLYFFSCTYVYIFMHVLNCIYICMYNYTFIYYLATPAQQQQQQVSFTGEPTNVTSQRHDTFACHSCSTVQRTQLFFFLPFVFVALVSPFLRRCRRCRLPFSFSCWQSARRHEMNGMKRNEFCCCCCCAYVTARINSKSERERRSCRFLHLVLLFFCMPACNNVYVHQTRTHTRIHLPICFDCAAAASSSSSLFVFYFRPLLRRC